MSHFNRVLITGAAGALGRALRQAGTALASHVRLTDRVASQGLAAHEEDRPCNLNDMAGVMAAVEGCDAIVHMGVKPGRLAETLARELRRLEGLRAREAQPAQTSRGHRH